MHHLAAVLEGGQGLSLFAFEGIAAHQLNLEPGASLLFSLPYKARDPRNEVELKLLYSKLVPSQWTFLIKHD